MHIDFMPAVSLRNGFRLLMVGGSISLACNVYAGSNIGERAFGVLVVGAFMMLEHHATKGIFSGGHQEDRQEGARRGHQGYAPASRSGVRCC